MSQCPPKTTYAGIPVADNPGSVTAGIRSPALLRHFQLVEDVAHFNHQRFPQRVVPAQAADAHRAFYRDR